MKWILFLVTILTVSNLSGQSLRPTDDKALYKIKATNYSQEPYVGDKILLTSIKTGEVYSNKTDADGEFLILLPEGDSYVIGIDYFGVKVKREMLKVPEVEGPMKPQFLILEYEVSQSTFVLRNVLFDYNKASLRPSSFPELQALVEAMNNKPTMIIEIAGHTDNTGGPEYNQKLSQSRAESVVAYLMRNGIEASRLRARGYGESEPVASNDTDAGRQENRRTEVRVIMQ